MFRVCAEQRPQRDIHERLLQYTYFQDGIFQLPRMEILQSYRIIVSTLGMSTLQSPFRLEL